MRSQNGDNFDQELWDFLKSSGNIPGTDDEVEMTEKLLAQRPPTVSPLLKDTDAVFRKMESNRKVVRIEAQPLTPTEESLSRAARDGKEISKETEDLMLKDRTKAEMGSNGH